ncbi:MAG: hypothetical protein ABJE79_04230 [Marinomonas sp.]|uniref:hypothetical protein n=1 Tax=unclassified Marinomonas TaxID=196814 RepID=UPI002934F594|nr:hypothetical protein [Marinomonas sp. GJ51-6]WOD07759.1 hypothetical protein ONZ50_00845 [Marinomonas sp. GJ51-6]
MKNTQSIIVLLDAVDTSHMTEAEKYAMFANAERAEYLSSGIVSLAKSIKKVFANLKTNLNPRTLKHA